MSDLPISSDAQSFMNFFSERDISRNNISAAQFEIQQYAYCLVNPDESLMIGRVRDMSFREVSDEVAVIKERLHDQEEHIEDLNREAEGRFLNRKISVTALGLPWNTFEWVDGGRKDLEVKGLVSDLTKKQTPFGDIDFSMSTMLTNPFRLGLLMTGRHPKYQTEVVGVRAYQFREPLIHVEFCS